MQPDRAPFAALHREHAAMTDDRRELRAFEGVGAAFCGTAYCVGMASGIAALTAGQGQGDPGEA